MRQIPDLSRALRSFALLALIALAALPMSTAAQEAAETNEDGEVTLNLRNAEITALINTVGEATGRNFVIDPRVRGEVTVVTNRPMGEDELYQVFLSILQVHGYSAVPSGEAIRIVPSSGARQLGSDGNERSDLITTTIRAEEVPVAQMVPILRPLVPDEAHLAAYEPSNLLIVSDRSDNVQRIRQLVAQMDRAGGLKIDIVSVENASAPEIARVLRSMQRDDEGAGRRVSVAVDRRSDALVLSGPDGARQRMRELVERLDEPVEDEGDTHVIYLQYADATDLVETLTGVSETIRERRGGASEEGDGPSIDIQADEATNALVITAPPAIVESLRGVIEQLDIRRAQIMVEAAIAEISSESGAERGVQWFGVDQAESGGAAGGAASRFGESDTPLESLLSLDTDNPANDNFQIGDGLSAVIGDLDGRVQFGAFIRALAEDSNTNILSTPSLVTLDNQEAEIRVAENRPFLTGQFSQEGQNVQNPFQTIERRDVGIILSVTPQINEGNSIQLDIEQESSNVIGESNTAGPITNRRTIKTSVLAEDGQVIALGGLMDDDVEEREQRIPLLGSMPLLGELFRFRSTSQTKRNLMLFMQPKIIRDAATSDALTGRKYSYLRAQQLEQRREGNDLRGDIE
ncbi:MAG: type II secretion system secretin GspD, partial [Ectothiorhodospiraceae bacterium]